MKKCFFFSLTILFTVSCSDTNGVPKGILPKKKMEAVLWDMISAGEFLNGYIIPQDSTNKADHISKIYGQVFQINHITREEFDKSYSYYQRHPELMRTILDSMSKKKIPVITRPVTTPATPVQKNDSLIKPINKLRKRIMSLKEVKQAAP